MAASTKIKPLLAIAASVLLAGACKPKAKAPTHEEATLEEARVHADKLAAALAPCDASKVLELIDLQSIVFSIAAERGRTRTEARGLLTGLRTSTSGAFCNEVQPNDSAKVLWVKEDGDTTKALIRILGEAGVNYYEHHVAKRRGKVVSKDFYVYLTGQKFSETLGDLFDAIIGDNPSVSRIDNMQTTLDDVGKLEKAGRFAEARKSLSMLPPKIRDNRAVRLQDVQLAANLDDAAYAEAIAAYEKLFPGDPSIDLVSIDGYYLRKEFDKAIATIDKLDKRLGGDPYLEFLRGSASAEAGQFENAKKHYQAALKAEPGLADGHWGLVNIGLQTSDHKLVADHLLVLRDEFKAIDNFAPILTDATYAEFAKSPEAARLKPAAEAQ